MNTNKPSENFVLLKKDNPAFIFDDETGKLETSNSGHNIDQSSSSSSSSIRRDVLINSDKTGVTNSQEATQQQQRRPSSRLTDNESGNDNIFRTLNNDSSTKNCDKGSRKINSTSPANMAVFDRSLEKVELANFSSSFHPDLMTSASSYTSENPPRPSGLSALTSLAFPLFSFAGSGSDSPGSGCREKILRTLQKYVVIVPLVILTIWALIYLLFGKEQASPGGGLFGVLLLLANSMILGDIMGVLNLPPLLGMLLAGIIQGNFPVPAVRQATAIPPSLLGPLRSVGSAMLIVRGAFSINPTAIQKYPLVVPCVSYLSCAMGALVAGTLIHFVIQFPVSWSALLGGIIAAMAGPAVMPLLTFLDSAKYQQKSSALAIAKAACGLDAILSITIAECALGFVFSIDGDILDGLAKGPGEVLVGGATALLWGLLLGTFVTSNVGTKVRTFLVFTGGLIWQIGLGEIGFLRAGPPGVFVGAVVTSILWRKSDLANHSKVNANLDSLWFLCQPLLFGILGNRVDLSMLDWSILGKSVACLAISLSVRILTAYGACHLGPTMSPKQKLFVAVSLVPKGTLQAELAPVALDMARRLNFGPAAEAMGYHVMHIAVMTIFLTSSIGSILLLHLGPRLLHKQA